MRKTTILSLLLLSFWYISTSSMKDPSNPPVARTGAPGETTCGVSGCHSGGTFTGTVTISGIPDTIAYNHSYTVTLTNTSNAVKAGFELTCLDSLNAKCGTLTTGTGTSVASQTSTARQYVRQSTPKTLSSGATSWTFTWKSPATAAGKVAKFYFVSLAANGNGNKTGDNILIHADTMVFAQPISGVSDLDRQQLVSVYPAQVNDILHIDLNGFDHGQVRIFSLSGALVYAAPLNSTANTIPVASFAKGVYVAQVEVNGKTIAKRFVRS